MKIVNLKQGTPEWHEFRRTKFTASDAAAMLGFSKYKTRDELIREKATGITEEIIPAKQALFDKGHEAEAMARALVESETGEDLFPATGYHESLTDLAASLDGMDLLGEELFEHKIWNDDLVSYMVQEQDLPDTHWPQVEQQLFVSGADRCRFVVSDGTPEKREVLMYTSNPLRLEAVVLGWAQFKEDLERYQPEPAKQDVIPSAVRELPAISYQFDKQSLSVSSSVGAFEAKLQTLVDLSKKELKTDQDFADAEVRAKVFGKAVTMIDNVIGQIQGEVLDIDTFIKELRALREQANNARLKDEKAVKDRKREIKEEIIVEAKKDLADHIAAMPNPVPVAMPALSADFGQAVKNKRTLKSVRASVNDELARAKIEANQWQELILNNTKTFGEAVTGTGYKTLFPDLLALLLKPEEDFNTAISFRINEHKASEEKRKQEQEAEARHKQSELSDSANEERPQPKPKELSPQRSAPAPTSFGGNPERTLEQALEHFCSSRGLGDQDTQELLDIINHFQIDLNLKAA